MAQDAPKNNFKLYGFVRNYFVYDSRESVSGTGDLFYYLPKDVNMKDGIDLNDHASLSYLSLTSRLGLDVSGYSVGNAHFGAKIEGDFYSGLSNSSNANAGTYFPGNTKISGTATARLRQAYATITWKDLPMSGEQKATVALKMGQAWHPMAADFPHLFSLEVGAPFGPFSRTPLVQVDATMANNWVLSAAAIWQMQYQSTGPIGASATYMKYGMTPEMYLAVAYKTKDFLFRVGADMLSIKPRVYGSVAAPTEDNPSATKTVKVSDRKTSLLYYIYIFIFLYQSLLTRHILNDTQVAIGIQFQLGLYLGRVGLHRPYLIIQFRDDRIVPDVTYHIIVIDNDNDHQEHNGDKEILVAGNPATKRLQFIQNQMHS